MNKRVFIIVAILLSALSFNVKAQTEVVLWTNQNLHGYIKVYHNNHYVGQITKYSSSAPKPHTSGFVTLTISGSNNTFYAEAQDGTRWYSEKMTLHSGNYYTIRLYSSSSSSKSTSSSTSSSSSGASGTKNYSSGSGYSGNSNKSGGSGGYSGRNSLAYSTGASIGSAITNVASSGVGISMEGYPNLNVQAGFSSLCGEFIGLGTELGGLGGAYLRGALYKNLFSKENPGGIDGWDMRLGVYMGNEKNTVLFNFALLSWDSLPGKVGGLEVSYARYFTPKLGLRGYATIYIDDVSYSEAKPLFDFSLGITYKIFSR